MIERFLCFVATALMLLGLHPAHASLLTPPTNEWEATQLYEIIKDRQSVFVEANAAYVASLQGSFPGIQSSADLVGKTDYDFYPPKVAAMFQADDAKVMQSGVPLTQFEINQLINGETRIIQVNKTPLFDGATVVGIRIAFAEIPELTDPVLVRGSVQARHRPTSKRRPAQVKIGALLSLTGSWSTLGNDCAAALQVGIAQLNKSAMVLEQPGRYDLVVRDTKLDPQIAVTQLRELHSQGVRVVIGPQSSAEARALLPVAAKLGMLLVSPSSTASSLSLARDNLVRFCPDDRLEAAASASVAYSEGIRTLVTVARNDVGNTGLYQSVRQSFSALGGTVAGGFTYAPTTTDFAPVVQNMASLISQASALNMGRVGVYLAGFDEVAELFRATAVSNLPQVPWYGGDGTVLSAALQEPGAAGFATGVGFPCPTLGIPADQVANSWPIAGLIRMRTGNETEAFALAAYDSLMVIARTVEPCGALPPSWALLPRVTHSANSYIGLTGPTTLNKAGDRSLGAYSFYKLQPDGEDYRWSFSGTWANGVFLPVSNP
jgi:branched-chain amino acid transport system substrate-binding protein